MGTGALAAAAFAFGPSFWRNAMAAPAVPGEGPYGPLMPADANGLMLPEGFSSREIARSGAEVAGYRWHIYPDGGATFATPDGGWILVSNSESSAEQDGGASAIEFAPDGSIRRAYRILGDSERNCAGGPTPWGTWLSCEEWDGGQVWECDPTGNAAAVLRPAMGTFTHESACVDPVHKHVYMTEDEDDGRLYRFTPTAYPDLSEGVLEIATVHPDGGVSWQAVPDPSAISAPTRDQVPGTRFPGGEGMWFDSGTVYFTTKKDNRVHAYDTSTGRYELIYDETTHPDSPLAGLDGITVAPSGDLYLCEDGDDLDICIITPERVVSRFMKATGTAHERSELAGGVFDPSGTRLYFASMRGYGQGAVYEVTGPFRGTEEPTVDPEEPAVITAPPVAKESKIRLRARREMRMRKMLRRGIKVRVKVNQPGKVAIAVRTGDLLSPKKRGSASAQPRQVVVARSSRRFDEPGTYRVRVRPKRRARRKLRRARRSARVQLTAQLTTKTGAVAVDSRRLRLRRKRKRKR